MIFVLNLMNLVLEMMNLVLKMMNCGKNCTIYTPKVTFALMMDDVLKTMNFALKLMNFVLKTMNLHVEVCLHGHRSKAGSVFMFKNEDRK